MCSWQFDLWRGDTEIVEPGRDQITALRKAHQGVASGSRLHLVVHIEVQHFAQVVLSKSVQGKTWTNQARGVDATSKTAGSCFDSARELNGGGSSGVCFGGECCFYLFRFAISSPRVYWGALRQSVAQRTNGYIWLSKTNSHGREGGIGGHRSPYVNLEN